MKIGAPHLAITAALLVMLAVGCGPAIDRDTVTVDTPDGTTEALVLSGEGSANLSIRVDSSPHIMVIEAEAPNGWLRVRAHRFPGFLIGTINLTDRLFSQILEDIFGINLLPHSVASSATRGSEDTYRGVVPLHIVDEHHTRGLEVNAQESWTIQIQPIDAAEHVTVPATVRGSADYVFVIDGSATSLTISANDERMAFGITGFGEERHSLFHTIEPVTDATVSVPDDVSVVFVRAAGDWEVTIE